MKRFVMMIGFVASAALPVVATDEDAVQEALAEDIVLRALVDELERGRVGLELEDLARPYFIEYALNDSVSVSYSAVLGAVTNRSDDRHRWLRTEVRVGSYELDNTNFRGGGWGWYGGMFGMMGGGGVPLEDDYNAIRQAVWLQTDSKYKGAAEALVQKKAFMESKQIEDKPKDFSREDPVVHLDPRLDLKLDKQRLEELAVRVSQVFCSHPDVQKSSVSVFGGGADEYLVNSEGTRLRTNTSRFSLSSDATVQADDGMKLSDSFTLYARTQYELPEAETLVKRCEDMVERLLALREAPKLESYTGPVLFDKEAAAALFLRRFDDKFTGGQRAVGGRTPPDDFEKKIGKRILPRWMSVLDDPTRREFCGEPVMGHYAYDDQGIPARLVQLVKKGRLKAQLMSRNPSKIADKSTGHGRGFPGPRASVGCLIIDVADGLDEDALKQELIEAFQDEDLEFGIRVSSFGGSSGGGSYGGYFGGHGFGGYGGGSTPLVMYKVYPDGREELVRGAEIASFDIKAFKRMLAAGKERFVLNTGGSTARTVVAPAMLFEELDLARIDRDFDKPPILESPLARMGETAAD